ncbi:MAG: site-2 protease family protein [Candidatus Marinimicrobia bacterium]|nr:site-2 protease family protein [Candidatus Neomarinimicrobiota bacterium]
MDENKRQEIIFHLGQWMQIVRARDEGKDLLIEGRLFSGITLREVRRRSRRLIRSIKKKSSDGIDVFIIKPVFKSGKRPSIHLILFLATILTTILAGALMEGVDPFKNIGTIWKGIPFSVTLMLILGVHELGHFLTAKKHHVDATLPYFIPAPTFIGTFGAFIKMRSPVRSRLALVEIGAAGPIAGFIVALPALFIGLSLSTVTDIGNTNGISLGNSLLMKIATAILYPGLTEAQDIMLHPIAFAAWIGMLVTMLNLLPIGQLDGGHIAFALLGKWYQKVAYGSLIAILILGIFSVNWIVWAALVFFLIRVKHPPIIDDYKPLSRREITIGLIALAIFVLTFIPMPFRT